MLSLWISALYFAQKVAVATHLTPNIMGILRTRLLLKKELEHAVEDDGFDIDLVEEGVEDLEFGEEEDSDRDLSWFDYFLHVLPFYSLIWLQD